MYDCRCCQTVDCFVSQSDVETLTHSVCKVQATCHYCTKQVQFVARATSHKLHPLAYIRTLTGRARLNS